jgi:hypothetical protein
VKRPLTLVYSNNRNLMHSQLQVRYQIKALLSVLFLVLSTAALWSAGRTTEGLLALYDFTGTDGMTIQDRSGLDPALDLKIEDSKAVSRTRGVLKVHGETQIRSLKTATKILNAVRQSGEITVEAWIHPENITQSGPARILTISRNSSERNFTLGQDGNKLDARLRTTLTNKNGMPSTVSPKGSLQAQLMHVIYTRNRSGNAFIYIDGKQAAKKTVAGKPSNWDGSLHLALTNETSRDRPWKGRYHLVALYGRALSGSEIQENFKAGSRAGSEELLARLRAKESANLFHQEIAPLLVKHCLECHDGATRKGKLDLSHKATALAGGKEGRAIMPGNGSQSLLWQMVADNEMPEDRNPLSAGEKALLKKWIDDGAYWPVDFIDPLAYKPDTNAGKIFIRRLTAPEYIETIRATVSVDISAQAQGLLPADLRADGFSNTAYNLGVDLKHVEAYARLAALTVEKMNIREFAARFSSNRSLTQKPMRAHISKLGKWILRGPLEDHEVNAYHGISTAVTATGGSFDEAIGFIVEAMLQSPRFMYLVEGQNKTGNPVRISDYELASRISYIIWGAPPDEPLMQAADKNELGNPATATAQIRRMLADPRARKRSERFAYEWLHLERLKHINPDKKRFPRWNNQLADDMAAETIAFFRDITWQQKRPLADLFNAQFTYATQRLAEHYHFSADDGKPSGATAKTRPEKNALTRYDLSAIPSRGGLLTHGSVLTIGGENASMVTRGLFILHDLLRGTIKDPPPGTDTTPVPSKPGQSQRTIAEMRINDKACGGCHKKFEPLAFGLERYDGLGTFRTHDRFQNLLREDGELLIPGNAKPVPYKSSAELMDLLAGNDRVAENITWKLTQFALGRPLTGPDVPIVKQIHAQSLKNGGNYTDTMTAIVLSDLVRMSQPDNSGSNKN